MPRLGLGQHLSQRLEQRLELKQSQVLRLRLAQLQAYTTSGETPIREQELILAKLNKEVLDKMYSNWENLHYRCMKRIKKKDRSNNVKKLISELRGLLENTKPNISEIKIILNLGLQAAKRNEKPSTVYNHMNSTLESEPIKNLDDRFEFAHEFLRLAEVLDKKDAKPQETFDFLHRTSQKKKYSDPENYLKIFNQVSRLAEKNTGLLKFVNKYFERILRDRKKVESEVVSSAFKYLKQLYQLSKEEVKTKAITDSKALFTKEDFLALRKNYSNIPIPVLANMVRQEFDDKLIENADKLFEGEYLQREIDAKRRIFRGLYALDPNRKRRKVINHLLTNIKSGKQLSKILVQLEILQNSRNFVYYFDETDGNSLLNKLKSYMINNNLRMLGLSREYKEKIAENPDTIRAHNLLQMISTYGGVLLGSYSYGIPLLREITEHIVDDDFKDWRYSHDKAGEQLKCLKKDDWEKTNALNAWKKNRRSERIVGDIKGVEPKINALKIIADELKDKYQATTGLEVIPNNIKKLEERIEEITNIFKSGEKDVDKKALGMEKRDLSNNHALMQIIFNISNINEETILSLGDQIDSAIKRSEYEAMKTGFEEAKKILNSKSVKNLERVTVIETDLPHKLMNIGKVPIQTCQRWNERTGYNKCLPAYVADSNKKLYQVLDESDRVIIRSIGRLLPFDKESPIVFLERPYAARWTKDYGKALFAQAAQTALEVSEELGEPVAVGSNDPRIIEIMKDFVKQYKFKLFKKTYERTLPKSKNTYEYSDSFGGCIISGARINRHMHYIFIERE